MHSTPSLSVEKDFGAKAAERLEEPDNVDVGSNPQCSGDHQTAENPNEPPAKFRQERPLVDIGPYQGGSERVFTYQRQPEQEQSAEKFDQQVCRLEPELDLDRIRVSEAVQRCECRLDRRPEDQERHHARRNNYDPEPVDEQMGAQAIETPSAIAKSTRLGGDALWRCG